MYFAKIVNSSKVYEFKFNYLFEMIHVRRCVLILKILNEMSRLKSKSNMLARQEQGVCGD